MVYLQTLWPLQSCTIQTWKASGNPGSPGGTPSQEGRCPATRGVTSELCFINSKQSKHQHSRPPLITLFFLYSWLIIFHTASFARCTQPFPFFSFLLCMLLYYFALCTVLRLNKALLPTKCSYGLIKVFWFWRVMYALPRCGPTVAIDKSTCNYLEERRRVQQSAIATQTDDEVNAVRDVIKTCDQDKKKDLCTQPVGHTVQPEWSFSTTSIFIFCGCYCRDSTFLSQRWYATQGNRVHHSFTTLGILQYPTLFRAFSLAPWQIRHVVMWS